MEPAFWHERWRENQIAFHKDEVNRHLRAHLNRLALSAGEQVMVPLCGKSRDVPWLHGQGFRVLGVELSPIAVHALFAENGMVPDERKLDAFTVLDSGGIRLLCGDFFDLRPEHTGPVAAVWDRAALIALPPAMRGRYASHLLGLVPASTPVLLVTVEYEQERMNGPPFSVPEDEVRALYSARREVTLVEEREMLDDEPRFRERGLEWMREKIYLLGNRDL